MEITLENPNEPDNPSTKHKYYFPTPLGILSLLSVEVVNDNDNNNDQEINNNVKNDNDNNDNTDKDDDKEDDKEYEDDKDNLNTNNEKNSNKNKSSKTTVRLMLCTPFIKVVANLKIEKAVTFSEMIPKQEHIGETFIKNDLSYTDIEQLNENGSLISEFDESFMKYNDIGNDINRAPSIISTSTAYSLQPSNDGSPQKITSDSRSPPRTPPRNKQERERVFREHKPKLSSLNIDVTDEKSKDGINNEEVPLDPIVLETEPQTLVASFLALFNKSPVKVVKTTDINVDTEFDSESCTDEYDPPTVDSQVKNNRRLSWSQEIRNDNLEDDTDNIPGRRYSISSNATNATDDGTFITYYTFQSNVIKAFLYEV